MTRRTRKKNNGFTIVEMLMTIGITVLLMTMMLGINRTGQRQVLLFREKSLFVANLNRVKNKALQTYLLPNRSCGFGLSINAGANQYTLFEDRDPVNPDCSAANGVYDIGEELIAGAQIQQFTLETGVQFVSSDFIDVLYIPPDPDVLFDGVIAPTGQAVIGTIDGNLSVTIQLNDAGQITTI